MQKRKVNFRVTYTRKGKEQAKEGSLWAYVKTMIPKNKEPIEKYIRKNIIKQAQKRTTWEMLTFRRKPVIVITNIKIWTKKR